MPSLAPLERLVQDSSSYVGPRSQFFQWLVARQLDFVVGIDNGTCLTTEGGQRHKHGVDLTLGLGEQLWLGRVRYALHRGRRSDIRLSVGSPWLPADPAAARKQPADPLEPWFLATTAPNVQLVVAWYRRRFWLEEPFRDDKSRLLLDEVRVESTLRLNRLLMALTIAVCWLCLLADPKAGVLPPNWNTAVTAWGNAGLIL